MDKTFFVQELEAHSGMLYRVAWTILRNDDACQDAMQEAALKAWEKRDSLRDARYFRTWITRILINACYDTPSQGAPFCFPDGGSRAVRTAAGSNAFSGVAGLAGKASAAAGAVLLRRHVLRGSGAGPANSCHHGARKDPPRKRCIEKGAECRMKREQIEWNLRDASPRSLRRVMMR